MSLFFNSFRMVLEPKKLIVQWEDTAVSQGINEILRQVAFLRLLSRLKMSGSKPPLPHMSSWCSA
jgi:hypothetical protein